MEINVKATLAIMLRTRRQTQLYEITHFAQDRIDIS